MKKFTEIKSSYIKGKLAKTNWDNRSYIEDLISLREQIINHPNSFLGSLAFSSRKNKYQEEYLELCKEVSHEMYEKEITRLENEKSEREKDEGNQKIKIAELKKDWLEAGGRI